MNFVSIQKIWVNTENTIVIPRSYSAVAQSDRSGHEDKGGAKALAAKRHIWQDWQRPGLHKLWYPGIRDTSTWSKFGAHGEHGDVFLFSNLGAL